MAKLSRFLKILDQINHLDKNAQLLLPRFRYVIKKVQGLLTLPAALLLLTAKSDIIFWNLFQYQRSRNMKKIVSFLFVALLAISCGSSNSPSSSSSTPTPIGFSWNGPIILTSIQNGLAFTEIANQSGPITNAAVTLSTTGSSVTLTYQTSSSYPVTYNGGVTILNLAYYTNSSYTYTASQPYTITAVFGGNTYTANVTAVGAPIFSTSGANLVCTWAGGGNENVIAATQNVSPYTQKTFGPNVTSPYSIPNSSLPGTSGQNFVLATIINLNNAAFTGTSNGSYFLATSQATTTY